MKRDRNPKKRYGLLVTFLVLNWFLVAWMVWKVDPESIKNIIIPGVYLPMLFLIFTGLFFLLSILLLSAKMALRWSVGITFFLLLRFLELGTLINGLLILGILVAVEFQLRAPALKQPEKINLNEEPQS